jgi:hypothetical protein
MPTNYPGSLDDLTNPDGADPMTLHAELHSDVNDSIEAVQTELGATPSGAFSTVGERFGSKANIVNTDGDSGITIYVGATPPSSPADGDIWLQI